MSTAPGHADYVQEHDQRCGAIDGAIHTRQRRDGPMPQTREKSFSAAQVGIPTMVSVSQQGGRTSRQRKLLELVEMEVRDFCRHNGTPRRHTTIVAGLRTRAMKGPNPDRQKQGSAS